MKPSVIMSVNNLAGVKKITLASDLALYLSKDKKVILVDCDPDGVLSNTTFNTETYQIPESFTEEDIIIKKLTKNIFILQGSEQLISLTPENTKNYREYPRVSRLLKREEVSGFDYIILDSIAVLKYITISSFVASSQIIVPIMFIYLEQLKNFFNYLQNIVDYYDLDTKIFGVLINESNIGKKQIIKRQIEVKKKFGIRILTSYYSRNALEQILMELETEADKLLNPLKLTGSRISICKEIESHLSKEVQV